jgi:hypothetical protein
MTEADARPVVHLTLDANAVAAPVHAAAVTCREVVDFFFDAMAKADLSKQPPGIENLFFRFDVKGPNLTAENRRALYESWILAKAFQDLMRGVRGSLEQAFLFTELVARPRRQVRSDSTLNDITAPLLKTASDLKFPELLNHVNSQLQTPLDFAAAYKSMQRARNCFEHRGGIVGKSDVGKGNTMELSFPRMKAFYERRGEEVELEAGALVDAEDGQPDVMLMMRLDLRRRRFDLGSRISFTASDFDEIAFACYYFGSQLATRLPKLDDALRGPDA